MLLTTKIAQPDTGTEICYPKTRVRDLDQVNWMKMVNLFTYVRGTTDLPLILSEDKSGIIKGYIDVSYAILSSMREWRRTENGTKIPNSGTKQTEDQH